MVGVLEHGSPLVGGTLRQTEPGPFASPLKNTVQLPHGYSATNPRGRVRPHSCHRGRFFVRDDPCALLREPIPRAHSLHGLATPRPVAAGLHRGLFH